MSIVRYTAQPCTRCGGNGYLSHYAHNQQGVCFRCAGSGDDPALPKVLIEITAPTNDVLVRDVEYNVTPALAKAAADNDGYFLVSRATFIDPQGNYPWMVDYTPRGRRPVELGAVKDHSRFVAWAKAQGYDVIGS